VVTNDFDLGGSPTWEWLRSTRSDPPAAATASSDRRETYTFALEQAEQMFRAAAVVGPATRPLLIFYGLSQAGRAIAAAATAATGDSWRLKGHGLRCPSLTGPLADVTAVADSAGSKGSFVRLSELLSSRLWEKGGAPPMSELWDNLPENRLTPLSDAGESRRTPLYVDHRSLWPPDPHPLVTAPVIYLPPWVISTTDGGATLDRYLSAYPGAAGYDSYPRAGYPPGAEPDFSHHKDGWGSLNVNWLLPGGAGDEDERLSFLRQRTRTYEGSWYFYPSGTGDSRTFHPLMAWWAVLFNLSMLSRYEPATWASHINVDSSTHAVLLERLLRQAITVVPKLVAETIDEVA
jgi:hypothetical protein